MDKTDMLIERGAMTPALWRERASAAYALGDPRRARRSRRRWPATPTMWTP